MLKKSSLLIFLTCALATVGFAQNSNSSTPQTRTRTSSTKTTTTTKPSSIEEQGAGTTQEETSSQMGVRTRRARNAQTGAKDPGAKGVLAAFEDLLNGIRNTDVAAVTAAYWNSPQLILFNNNGTVTKGWEQMRKNRESSYPDLKDVKLDTRDVRVQMLGRDGAVVMCLWTQSQTFRGTSETATGRMTLAFRRVGNTWKAVHLHTSPDAPDPSRVMPSEQTPAPTPRPQPTKTRP
jgi:ketosteroid isomerase-like protein